MRRAITGLLVLVGVLAFLLSPAEAAIYSFNAVTANDVADVATGEAQLFVDVTDPGGAQTLFTFFNIGPLASSIADVYFDDGALLGIALIDNSDPGVSFSQLAAPPNLPGGTTPFRLSRPRRDSRPIRTPASAQRRQSGGVVGDPVRSAAGHDFCGRRE